MSRALLVSIMLIGACKSSDERTVSEPLADPTVIFEQEPFDVDTDWPDNEADTDTDTDTDTDADTDTDTDADTDTSDTGGPQSFEVVIENTGTAYPWFQSGVFNTPVGAGAAAPIGPGESYEVSFSAPPDGKLSFATMFIPSNDFFFAPDPAGIDLFDGLGVATEGDITSLVKLWDAGTEVDQEPGTGADQPQRSPLTGDVDADTTVREAVDTFTNLPAITDVISVSLVHSGDGAFVLTIENVSTATTLSSTAADQAVPLSPGVFIVHSAGSPLFDDGVDDRGEGLEALAEDGDPAALGAALAAATGLTVPMSPGVYAVHTGADPLFTVATADRGLGLENVAEDGDTSVLGPVLAADTTLASSGVFDTPDGTTMAGGIGPGSRYVFQITAEPGDKLSFATMFVTSNDLFLGPDGDGIELFPAGTPVSGDVTASVQLWDLGTEVNQQPGIGSDQVQFQDPGNPGPDEGGTVGPVSDGFTYPAVTDVVTVTITPN